VRDSATRRDLTHTVVQALDVASRTVSAALAEATQGSVAVASGRESREPRPEARPLVLDKVLGETALLLRAASRVAADARIQSAVADLAAQIAPHAHGPRLHAALTLEPGLDLDHAFTHILLTDLGHGDPVADALLDACLASGVDGPERTPHRELERAWLLGVRRGAAAESLDLGTLSRSCLARPLDALGAATEDWYAFTHVLLYVTDLGRSATRTPRPIEEITADAEAGLAASLDAENFDLAAELLWTWPMLGLPWCAASRFAFEVLAAAVDRYGFLPGPGFSAAHHAGLRPADAAAYALRTSYHATIAWGVLCSTMLANASDARVESMPSSGAAAALESLLLDRPGPRSWQEHLRLLSPVRRDALAPMLLTIALRRARDANDLTAVRAVLAAALELGLVGAPAARQAVGLLRRATLLAAPVRSSRRESELVRASG
jgi:hypothetical protein